MREKVQEERNTNFIQYSLSVWLSLEWSSLLLSPLPCRLFSFSHSRYFIPHLYSYLCHPHLSCRPNFSSFFVSFQLWVHKGVRTSQKSIWGESQGARLNPSMSAGTVGEPPPPDITAGVTNRRDTCFFSHSPLYLLLWPPNCNIPWNPADTSHRISIFYLQLTAFWRCKCLTPHLWFISGTYAIFSTVLPQYSQNIVILAVTLRYNKVWFSE